MAYSKIFDLDFSWDTQLSGTLKGPWGTLRAWKRPKNATNHQILVCPPFKWVTPCFPIVKSSHSKIFILNSHVTLGYPFGTIGNPWGCFWAHQSLKMASNHQIFLCPPFLWITPSLPIVKSSHKRKFYLDFSWHTRSSIGSPGAPQNMKMANKCFK